ncbi:hypothetical protein CLG85_020515 [Yangia mangrovi]|uniref:Restriction endonuclease n=1 Tax=Alloyangia mangrovi TaxID=1779329 RepID=A0ABT2KR30_9RHOB|nr:DUF6615 family protein [Alloyangia mangrovi]MCT4372563.1 hypothetical protein [Alloyangia mangrovi]
MKLVPNFCRSFQEEAARVWADMSDAARFDIARGEETTTEHLLLRLARKHHGRGLTIKTFTKDVERDNGADWGFWFGDGHNRGLPVRVQAKRLYRKSGRYDQLYHPYNGPSKSGQTWANQCEAMLGWRDGAVPLYVFYNDDGLGARRFWSAHKRLYWRMWCGFPFSSPEWGISAASALAIKSADWGKDNRPGDFPMIPWHCLVCPCCWDDHPTDTSLPSLIGHGLQQLYNYSMGDAEEDLAAPTGLGFFV